MAFAAAAFACAAWAAVPHKSGISRVPPPLPYAHAHAATISTVSKCCMPNAGDICTHAHTHTCSRSEHSKQLSIEAASLRRREYRHRQKLGQPCLQGVKPTYLLMRLFLLVVVDELCRVCRGVCMAVCVVVCVVVGRCGMAVCRVVMGLVVMAIVTRWCG